MLALETYTPEQLDQINRAIERADRAGLHIRPAFYNGQRAWEVDAEEGPEPHYHVYRKLDDPRGVACTCPADFYRKGCYVACKHIMTVALRMKRARKRGTIATYRSLMAGIGLPV